MSGQRTLSPDVIEFDPTNYPRLLEIHNANYPDYARSVGEWRIRDESVDRSKYYLQRYAFLESNAMVGFGEISHVTEHVPPLQVLDQHPCRSTVPRKRNWQLNI